MADEQEMFLCIICNKGFKYQALLDAHVRRHAGEDPYVCAVCDRAFSRRYQLSLHMKGHKTKEDFTCTECNKVFKFKSQLKNHTIIRHTDERPFSCKVCGETFKNASSVTWHMKSHSSERPFGCSVCQKRFKNKASLTFHLKSLTEEEHLKLQRAEKPFLCTQCKSGFSTKMGLDNHQRMHSAKQPQLSATALAMGRSECESQSNKDLPTDSDVADQKIHLKEKTYSCRLCCGSFASRVALTDHYKTHTDAGSACNSKTNLVTSELIHCRVPDETNYMSSNADLNHRKAINQISHMNISPDLNHGIVPGVQNPFYCTLCKKGFTRKRGLQIHQSIHSYREPFCCPHCPKVYKSTNSLKVHLRTHFQGRHSCTICYKKFPSDSSQILHLQSHKEKNINSCLVCRLVFNKKENLLLHLKSHRGEKMPLQAINNPKVSHTVTEMTTNQMMVSAIAKVEMTSVLNLESNTLLASQSQHSTCYPCFVCGQSFAWYDLRMHLGVHTGEFLQCADCGKIIQSDSEYILHRKTHQKKSETKPLSRIICPENGPSSPMPTSYACSVCDMRLSSIELLICHIGTHTGEKILPFLLSK